MRVLHGLIRRYWFAVERTAVAAALAGLLLALLRGLPAYPPYWDVVLCALVFGAALGSPPLAYFLAVAAAAYPIYTLSIYLLAIFLSVALLGQRLFINNLGATLLGAATPWLSGIYLPWLAPLLGGLWWGPAGGALVGGLGALWGIGLAGMTGQPPDWLQRMGMLPALAVLPARFGGIDSLDTLWRLVEPLAPDAIVVLLYFLQVLLWAGVGALVGRLGERAWVVRRRPGSEMALAWLGAAALLAGHVGAGLWLRLYVAADLQTHWRSLALAGGLSGLVVSLAAGLHYLVEYPMTWGRRSAGGAAARRSGAPGSVLAALGRRLRTGRAAPSERSLSGARSSDGGRSTGDALVYDDARALSDDRFAGEAGRRGESPRSTAGDQTGGHPAMQKDPDDPDDVIMLELD